MLTDGNATAELFEMWKVNISSKAIYNKNLGIFRPRKDPIKINGKAGNLLNDNEGVYAGLSYNAKGEFDEDFSNSGPNGETMYKHTLNHIINGKYLEGSVQLDYFQNKACRDNDIYGIKLLHEIDDESCAVHLSLLYKYTIPTEDCTESKWAEVDNTDIRSFNYNSPKVHTVTFSKSNPLEGEYLLRFKAKDNEYEVETIESQWKEN